jgi:inositol-phosphate phosphatase/L-galactose 1-phosphate phosphatase/histidinol-phosphatase
MSHTPIPPFYLRLAHAMADEAGQIARRHFRTSVPVEIKKDDSPVSLADREIERKCREILAAEVPDHHILGEEEGGDADAASSGWAWVIDPIDGTRAFLAGVPTFGVLIALCKDGVPVLGVLDQPIMRDRWVGVLGEATTLNGMPIRTRACLRLEDATFSTTSAFLFRESDQKSIRRIADTARSTVYGKDCVAYGLLAGGWVDVVVESGLKAHDILALVPIIEGASGVLARWDGMPLSIANSHNGVDVVACGDESLLGIVQAILR